MGSSTWTKTFFSILCCSAPGGPGARLPVCHFERSTMLQELPHTVWPVRKPFRHAHLGSSCCRVKAAAAVHRKHRQVTLRLQ